MLSIFVPFCYYISSLKTALLAPFMVLTRTKVFFTNTSQGGTLTTAPAAPGFDLSLSLTGLSNGLCKIAFDFPKPGRERRIWNMLASTDF